MRKFAKNIWTGRCDWRRRRWPTFSTARRPAAADGPSSRITSTSSAVRSADGQTAWRGRRLAAPTTLLWELGLDLVYTIDHYIVFRYGCLSTLLLFKDTVGGGVSADRERFTHGDWYWVAVLCSFQAVSQSWFPWWYELGIPTIRESQYVI